MRYLSEINNFGKVGIESTADSDNPAITIDANGDVTIEADLVVTGIITGDGSGITDAPTS